MLLLGNQSLDISLFGLKSGRVTRGHRFHGKNEITIPSPERYQAMLRDEYVITDHQERKAMIRQQVEALVSGDETAVIDDGLLDEVTGLVEWPVALRGAFDEAFLSVPRQALISSMREHQKYFHIEARDGSLVPAFITISNIESSNPQAVIYGNEKVIRPRLADAAFFFETDKTTSLAAKSERLESVLFQRDLGTLASKQRRISRLASALCEELGADEATVSAAGAVLKADLVSDMVGEFPELQGIAGRHYALNDGLSDAVADAIEQHYWPKFSGRPATFVTRISRCCIGRQARHTGWHLWYWTEPYRLKRSICFATCVRGNYPSIACLCTSCRYQGSDFGCCRRF